MGLNAIVSFVFLISSVTHAAPRAVIATTDFATGSLSVIDTETNVAQNDLLLVHSDAKVRTFDERVYVINRLGQDNILILQKDDLSTPLFQFSTGNGTNPHEIVVLSESKAYVSLYERDYVLIVNPTTGDSLGAVSLADYADEDGLPEASQMALFGDKLFVAVQRLNRDAFFAPTEFSLIAVIDVQNDVLLDLDEGAAGTQGIAVEGKQPFGVAQRGGRWIVASVGTFGSLDGGIEVIDLVNLRADGIVISETALGGDVGPVTMLSDTEGYVVLTDASFVNSVRRFDLSSGSVSDPLPDLTGGFTPAVAVSGTSLYVLDRGTFADPASGGIKIFDTTTDLLTAGPIATGLPPSDITFVDELTGDFDGNGSVAFEDFLLFGAAFGKAQGQEGFDSTFDLNSNATIDFDDFLIFASTVGSQ